jgi:dihydrofolate reductase
MQNKTRSLIVACTNINNGNYPFGIGVNGKLPWKLPKEMKYFKKTTKKIDDDYPEGVPGIPIIMGRKSFEGLLPGRKNIILTEQSLWQPPDYEDQDDLKVINSPWEALDYAEKCPGNEIFIIGGEEIYKWYATNVIIHRLYITFVDAPLLECDRFFPIGLFDLEKDYAVIKDEVHGTDKKNIYGFNIKVYERKDFEV